MSYNGYPTQADFHAAMRDGWKRILSTPEGRARHQRDYGIGSRSHASCDHLELICNVSE